jgi:hypothetical protein
MLNTHEPDDCCAKALSKALRSGALDKAETWKHEKCGLEWRPVHIGEARHWQPVVICEVMR